MKISTILAGVCLLTLTITSTDALEKKQDVNECLSLALEAAQCLSALLSSDPTTVCSCSCKSALYEYFDQCDLTDTLRANYDQLCGFISDRGAAEDEADNGGIYAASC